MPACFGLWQLLEPAVVHPVVQLVKWLHIENRIGTERSHCTHNWCDSSWYFNEGLRTWRLLPRDLIHCQPCDLSFLHLLSHVNSDEIHGCELLHNFINNVQLFDLSTRKMAKKACMTATAQCVPWAKMATVTQVLAQSRHWHFFFAWCHWDLGWGK